jgi:hypothetical protein
MADHRASDPLDRLLAGGSDAAPGSGERALVDALRRLRGETEQAPADEVAEEHVAAIVSLAQEHAHTAPTVTPAASPVATWRRRLGLAGGISLGKVALAAGVAAAATGGGLAATGSLPAPAQQAVADVGDRLGIPFPAPLDPADVPDQRRGDDAPVELAPPEVTPPPTESLPTPEPLPTPQVVPPRPSEPGPTLGPPEHSPADPPEERPTPTEVPPAEPPAEGDGADEDASDREDDAPPAAAPAPPDERDGDEAADDEDAHDPRPFRVPRGVN